MIKKINFYNKLIALLTFVLLHTLTTRGADTLKVDWKNKISVSNTTPTLQIVENPLVRRNTPIHTSTFKALKNLEADFVRYVPWFPYPKLAVAELQPPSDGKTFWDFKLLDSTMVSFMDATKGHSVVVNFSTTPAWMWKTDQPVKYPENPYQTEWNYNQGRELRDSTFKEVADYYARLISWYTKGGFTDEMGHYHKSGHFFNIPYWEVLNEPDLEHSISPKLYTKIYDAIVLAMKKVAPQTKFIGLGLAFETNPEYFEYFLNAKNHKPGVPLDGISYHRYTQLSYERQPLEESQYTYFENADAFITHVNYIENIRKRLSPNTITMINEIGTMTDRDTIPTDYWNLSGAVYAHIYLELIKIGIEVAGESQLVGYPSQFPDVSMINWTNGNPNARYWVLKLLLENFGKGDELVGTHLMGGSAIDYQAFSTKKGKRILLINRRNKVVSIVLPAELKGSFSRSVDTSTRENNPSSEQLTENEVRLKPFSVTVIEAK